MASRDLQIVRASTARHLPVSDSATAFSGETAGRTIEPVLAAFRRQWLLLLSAACLSAAAALWISDVFAVKKVTARLTLSSQALPATSQNVYIAPNPNVAAVLLKSPRILEPVAQRHELPPVPVLTRSVTLYPNLTTASIDVALVQNDPEKAVVVLNDMASELIRSIADDRRTTLSEHAEYISELLVSARNDLSEGRKSLSQLEDTLRLAGGNTSQQRAELYDLAHRDAELQASIEDCRLREARLHSDLQLLNQQFESVRRIAFRVVLEGRRRQAERVSERLTRTAPAAAVNAEILSQLQIAEQDFASKTAASGTEAADQNGLDEYSRDEADTSKLAADELTEWVERITTIGRGTLGELEPETLESVRTAWNRLSKISDDARRVQFEAKSNQVDLQYYVTRAEETDRLKRQATHEDVKRSSSELMELKLEVDEKEKRFSQLSQQLDQINQLRECELTEYVITSPAAVNAVDDISSNRRNLFVCTFLGCGLLLTGPLVVIELLRLRPSPVTMISRRWNLPVLGSHPAGVNQYTETNGFTGSQDLRLMALRIQQSLNRPGGRVVLFAGLDHEESPFSLIRSLAWCLAQREETVLLIEVPATHAAGPNTASIGNDPQRPDRPGVAEYLAGKVDDAASLVVSMGANGIDFLSRGHAAVASEAMASSRLTEMIEQFRAKYSMIILCGPSTLYPADLQMLAARADGLVFTVNQSSLHAVYGNEVIGDLLELGAPILGLAEQPRSTSRIGAQENIPVVDRSRTELQSV